MNKVDMYMSLVDETEANSILKFFKCNVRLNNLDFKKTKIKTIIRTNHSINQTKGITNPFMAILMRHKITEWDCLNEKELLITLNKDIDKIPDYVKFANLILKYPDKKNEYIELINENKNNNKYVFNFDLNFENEKEVNQYCSKLSDGQENILKNIEMYFLKAVNLDLLKGNAENLKDVKNWDMIKLYNSFKIDNQAENIFMKFEYIKTHDDIEKDVLNKFYLDILFYLITLFEGSRMDVHKTELLKLKTETNELENNYKKSEKDKVEKEKEYKKVIKELKSELSSIKLNTTEFDKMKSEIRRYSNENNNLLKKTNELINKNELLDTQFKNNKKELSSYHKQITNMELYYEYNFPQNQNNEKLFGIIHSTNINIVKIIFSEVEFIHIDDWKGQINNVKKIYIQREGISTRELTKIKNYCSKNGIKIIENISIHDEKSLIEIVSIIKNK